mmetsp:Transcript_21736/g.39285  ORF Transcript_21736/g.39285 Transcript_21736/m.39285 type:complete len:84 (+) Transcript_21736:181-432(+)
MLRQTMFSESLQHSLIRPIVQPDRLPMKYWKVSLQGGDRHGEECTDVAEVHVDHLASKRKGLIDDDRGLGEESRVEVANLSSF